MNEWMNEGKREREEKTNKNQQVINVDVVEESEWERDSKISS